MISRFFNIMRMLAFHDMVNLFDPECQVERFLKNLVKQYKGKGGSNR